MKDQTIAVNKIKDSYCEKPVTKLDELKSLDKKVKRPARIFAYVFGVTGALVLGVGMCLAMKVIGNLMALGIVVGVAGIIMVSVNHLIHKQILKKRKSKYCRKNLNSAKRLRQSKRIRFLDCARNDIRIARGDRACVTT